MVSKRKSDQAIVDSRLSTGVTDIKIDYPIYPRQRWGEQGNDDIMTTILGGGIMFYQSQLELFAKEYLADLREIRWWGNTFFSGLDGVLLYSYMRMFNTRRYIEVGSGASTLFANQASLDGGFELKITSIDPEPRQNIEELCDESIRTPLENVSDLEFIRDLRKGDVFFMDGSHRVFQNNDSVTFMFDVLPMIRSGVLIQVHDICLPWDYPEEWSARYYSEQYLMAAYLMGGHKDTKILMPSNFACKKGLAPKSLQEFGNFGSSLWLQKL